MADEKNADEKNNAQLCFTSEISIGGIAFVLSTICNGYRKDCIKFTIFNMNVDKSTVAGEFVSELEETLKRIIMKEIKGITMVRGLVKLIAGNAAIELVGYQYATTIENLDTTTDQDSTASGGENKD